VCEEHREMSSRPKGRSDGAGALVLTGH